MTLMCVGEPVKPGSPASGLLGRSPWCRGTDWQLASERTRGRRDCNGLHWELYCGTTARPVSTLGGLVW